MARMMWIPDELLPGDGRFGSGPAKIRPEALDYLAMRSDIMGTSHRQPPVKQLVAAVQESLAELYRIPAGYEVVLGNGGSTLFWDMAVFSLIEQRSAHGVFGEFSRKFAKAATRAPHLADPAVFEAEAGSIALPDSPEADVHAWAQNETSTGAAAPVERRGSQDSLVLIDATSAAGGIDADIAETDVYYFAPQKNFSSDGGLWLAFASPDAIERAARLKAGGRYLPEILDFSIAVDNSRKNQTLNTPALATLLLLEDQLGWMLDLGGMEEVAARCRRSTQTLYDWAESRDFASPFVTDPEHRSPVVATIDIDEAIPVADLIAILRRNGIRDIDPYRALNRNQIRVGCYASVDPEDVAALTACIDHVVERL